MLVRQASAVKFVVSTVTISICGNMPSLEMTPLKI